MKIDHDLNELACADPKPGDFWLERATVPYFLVLKVDVNSVFILSAFEDKGFNVKNAKVLNDDFTWCWDVLKWSIVTKEWLRKTVRYSSDSSFVADVLRGRQMSCVKEWEDLVKNNESKKYMQYQPDFFLGS